VPDTAGIFFIKTVNFPKNCKLILQFYTKYIERKGFCQQVNRIVQ